MNEKPLDAEKLNELAEKPGAAWAEVKRALKWVSDEDAEKLVADLLAEAKEALASERSELVLLLRSHENLAVVTFNLMGLITSVCKNSSELLGRPVDSLLGQPIDSVLSARAKGVQVTSDELLKAEKGKVVHALRDHVREDGTNFEAEHTIVAVVGKGEHVMGFVREIREVTDHKLHEVHIAELDRVITFLISEQESRSGAQVDKE